MSDTQPKIEFNEVEVCNEAIEQMKLGVDVDSAFIRGSRRQFERLVDQLASLQSKLTEASNERDALKSELDEAKKRIAELESNGNPTVWAYEQATKALRLRHDEIQILRRGLEFYAHEGWQNPSEYCGLKLYPWESDKGMKARKALAEADALSKPEIAAKGEM